MPFPRPYKTESEEAEKCAENMTYREPIYNLEQAKSVSYRKATFSKVNELPNELEQKPVIHAKWERGYSFPDGAYWKCLHCNELIKVKIPMHYCNNCGAKMDKE